VEGRKRMRNALVVVNLGLGVALVAGAHWLKTDE
jgi:hypothetical protein